jgi:hypothetical protein
MHGVDDVESIDLGCSKVSRRGRSIGGEVGVVEDQGRR